MSDLAGWQVATVLGPRLSTMRVQARGEMFRIVQLEGQLIVGTKQNGAAAVAGRRRGASHSSRSHSGATSRERAAGSAIACTSPLRVAWVRARSAITPCCSFMAARSGSTTSMTQRWYRSFSSMRRRFSILAGSCPCPMSSAATSTSASWRRRTPTGLPFRISSSLDTLDGLEPGWAARTSIQRGHGTPLSTEGGPRLLAPACKKQFVADPSDYLSA